MKELNIDLDFDDLVVTQITCKTCKLFALANMTLNFITGEEVCFFSCKIVMPVQPMTGKLGMNPQTLERVTENGFE